MYSGFSFKKVSIINVYVSYHITPFRFNLFKYPSLAVNLTLQCCKNEAVESRIIVIFLNLLLSKK